MVAVVMINVAITMTIAITGLSPALKRKKEKVRSLSCVQLSVTPWTVAYQAPLSMEFSRQEYRSGLLFPSPGDLSNPEIKPASPALQAHSLLPSHQGSFGRP